MKIPGEPTTETASEMMETLPTERKCRIVIALRCTICGSSCSRYRWLDKTRVICCVCLYGVCKCMEHEDFGPTDL